MNNLFTDESSAKFSPCRRYRYTLLREWSSGSLCVFCMLNPSTADEVDNDPTIRRCISFAKSWGHGSLVVVNLFAYRSPDPFQLAKIEDPVGELNDQYISTYAARAERFIAAWGCWGKHKGRAEQVLKILPRGKIKCLGTTKSGHPKHPLYLAASTMSVDF